MSFPEKKRSPVYEWNQYVAMLERDHLEALARQQEKEAQALAQTGEEHGDSDLKVAARAKYAAAKEFRGALKKLKGDSDE